MSRKVLLVSSPQSLDKAELVLVACQYLAKNSVSVFLESEQIAALTKFGLEIPSGVSQYDGSSVELGIVLGGDGSILRAAELLRGTRAPILGINAGHVGFMAEAESGNLIPALEAVVSKRYEVRDRLALEVVVTSEGKESYRSWALNEVTVEREKATMVELFLEIDNRPISRWGCDGLICSTPTGSTAYAFSAGGPVVWPQVDALVVLPISAHALFSRPLVISPKSVIAVGIESTEAFLSADALRKFPLIAGDRVVVTKHSRIIQLAHLKNTLFSDRLVAKFKLPVEGWRGE